MLPWRWGSPPLQGSLLLSELCCLEPSSLNRPHPPHPRAHRDFTAAYTQCLRCAGAPRRPAGGSGLSLTIPSWHAALWPRRARSSLVQIFEADIAFAEFETARHSQFFHNAFDAFATSCQVARSPLYGSDRYAGPSRAFISGLPTDRVALNRCWR